MGWWFTLIGFVFLLLGTGFSLIGFVISPQQTIITTIRSFFSQTQSIKILPPSLGGNDVLNLDNLGTLKLHVPYSLTSITLLLDVVPTTLPDKHDENITVEGAQFYNQSLGTQYVFNITDSKRHEIEIAGRIFVITLLKISKLNVPSVPGAIEYQFGIAEK